MPYTRNSLNSMLSDQNKAKQPVFGAAINPLPANKAKKLQIQMQFGAAQKPGSTTTPASNITRPSTATHSYLNQRTSGGGPSGHHYTS